MNWPFIMGDAAGQQYSIGFTASVPGNSAKPYSASVIVTLHP
ncbi:hypothetical protein [Mycobacterium malmoense]|nr:hypothetical protein [Mycobacterium malmoense]